MDACRLSDKGVRNGLVARLAELLYQRAGGRAVDVPGRVRRPEYARVRTAVAVIIARHGQIAAAAVRKRVEREIPAPQDEPFAGRGFPEGNISLAVARKVGGNCLVRSRAELRRKDAAEALRDPPLGTVRAVRAIDGGSMLSAYNP